MSNDLSAVDSQELRSRLEKLLPELDLKFKTVGPLVAEIGMLRAEVDIIYRELVRRGLVKSYEPQSKDGI